LPAKLEAVEQQEREESRSMSAVEVVEPD